MILAKTSINYQYIIARGFTKKDLFLDLYEILNDNDLYQSYEWVKMYQEYLQKNVKKTKTKSLIKNKRRV